MKSFIEKNRIWIFAAIGMVFPLGLIIFSNKKHKKKNLKKEEENND